jgi:hypothetical protein
VARLAAARTANAARHRRGRTTNSNQTPHLAEANPQGTNPKILLLNLSITSAGTGLTVIDFKQVTFTKKISKDQYTSVDIVSDGEQVGTAKVETVV